MQQLNKCTAFAINKKQKAPNYVIQGFCFSALVGVIANKYQYVVTYHNAGDNTNNGEEYSAIRKTRKKYQSYSIQSLKHQLAKRATGDAEKKPKKEVK